MGAKKTILVLIAILLLGLLLRIHDLATESLWLDEGISIRIARLNLLNIVNYCASGVHPPLHFIILHYWTGLFGDSEFSARFLSVIFGILALIVVYKLGSLIFDKETGILSALLMAISAFYIGNSQEARMYSLAILLALSSIYFFIKLFEKDNFSVKAGYVLFTTLLFYTQYSGFFILLVQNVFFFTMLLLSKKPGTLNLRRWLLIQAVLLISFSPWLYFLVRQLALITENTTWMWQVPSLKSLANPLRHYAGSYPSFYLFLILAAFSLVPPEEIRKRKTELLYFHRIYFLFLWVLTPIVFLFILAQFRSLFFITRYVAVAAPAFYLLVAQGIRNLKNKYLKVIIVCVAVIFSLMTTASYYVRVTKNQWREVANYIDTNAKSKDVLLFHKGYFQENVFDYYSKRKNLIKIPLPESTRKLAMTMKEKAIGITEKDIKETWPRIKGHDRVWLILCHDRDHRGLIKETLRETFEESYAKKYFGIEVYLYEAKNK